MATTRATAEATPTPQWWTAFVLGWIPIPIFGVVEVLRQRHSFLVTSAVLLILGVFTVLYLWLTLRRALMPADFSTAGPDAALLRRRLLVLAVMTPLIPIFGLLVPDTESWWIGMLIVVAAGLSLPARYALGVTAIIVILSLTSAQLLNDVLESALLLELAFVAAAIAVRRMTISVEQLRLAREELARLAVAEERVRFARDLHDLLGHSLSMIVLKTELAGRLLPGKPEQAATEVREVEQAAREALQQVRAAVAGYRHPELRSELAAARELLAAAGITLMIDDRAGPLPTAVDGLLAWTVREGVTNVIRHSRARSCVIVIAQQGDEVRVEMADDGHGGDDAAASGSGLIGLAERAAALDGRLESGPLRGGGFRLQVVAPLAGAATEAAS
jgi:two-component system sensor histidine kinase DesK